LLVVGCWLLVVGCWLLVVGCWLLVVGCWLLVVGCWLLRTMPTVDLILTQPSAALPDYKKARLEIRVVFLVSRLEIRVVFGI
jgi:hypothetical protein